MNLPIKPRASLFLNSKYNRLLAGFLVLIFLSQIFIFITYSRHSHQREFGVNQDLMIQQVIQLIQTVKLAPDDKKAKVVNAVAIPNIKVSLSHVPEWKPSLNTNSLWKILSALRKQENQMQMSLELGQRQWLNITAIVTPRPWTWQIMILILELATAICVLSFFWSVNRFATPIKQFSEAADRLGADINSPPITVPDGPEEVQHMASAMNGMQKCIQELIRDRTLMLAAMSHDLRTPITRLKLRAQFLDDSEQYEKSIADLNQMEEMISAILSFARDDRDIENKRKLDLLSLLASICTDYADVGKAVTFNSDTEQLMLLQGRPLALKRAFTNFIDNALKYGQQAKVEVSQNAKHFIVSIKDAGPGIPEGEMDRVFSPFYRGDKSRSRDTGGTGLGLAVAKDIMRAHDADIRLYNLVESGLCVEIKLPKLVA